MEQAGVQVSQVVVSISEGFLLKLTNYKGGIIYKFYNNYLDTLDTVIKMYAL